MLSDQRTQGRHLILSTIRRHGRIARIDLARHTNISQATVTAITAEMLRVGLIEEVTPENPGKDSRRGRPRVDLKLRGAAHLVAGLKIANRSISVALMDFEGTLVAESDTKLGRAKLSAGDFADVVRQALTDATATIGLAIPDLSGVGIGIAGFIDAIRGFVHWSPSLAERNIDLREVLAEKLDVPVFIDNDANLVAMAEQYFGRGQDVADFLVVTIESGVGLGIVVGGEIYRGTRGCGAELGHTKVQLDGALCRCGQRGCLEAYVADYALLREAAVGGGLNPDEGPDQQVQSVLQAARDGDPLAQSIVARAGRMFAMGLANLVNIFDPQLIILSGERMQSDHLYAEEVIDSIRRSIVQIDMPPPEIVIHKWGDLMWAKGAAAYALDGVAAAALRGMGENAA